MNNPQTFSHLHTTFCIRDLDTARSFYGDVLGLREITDRPLTFPGLWYDLGNAQLHLILDPHFQTAIASSEKWGRSPHLALSIADLETIRHTLETRGISYQNSASGRPALFVQDPDGNTIELSIFPSNPSQSFG
ncbi:MAG: glyoxalase [Oscillatoriales cyanobacterium]|nr:MAG: glyoxalase [Oscillatoriales cyanobacterium]